MRKLIIPLFLICLISIFSCPVTASAQSGDVRQSSINIKNTFFGHWKNDRDPNLFIDIYKEGSLIIVQRGSLIKQGAQRNRFIVTYEKGNRITVDLGYGLSPLTISDDGSKISFLGNEYSKK